MKSTQATIINAIILLAIGFWGYAANNFSAHTAFVPMGFGLLLLVFAFYTKHENKVLAYIVFGLTLIVMFAMLRPFLRNADQGDLNGMIRVGLEMASCAMALIVYIRNFKSED
ncbi:MAG: hypothetical protein IPL42_12505 [Saprospiraceae bacterium]|nr:hypothetical protein [Saprospiraceae bacterium]